MRPHLILMLALLCLLPLLSSRQVQSQQRPPLNVLFIAVDDLNTSLRCYGNRLVQSPNIDRLARQGVRFDRAYCQYPLCNPSRTSLLTGRLPTVTRVLDNRLWVRQAMPEVVTLPEHFRENGYVTLRTGKIFHGGLDDERSWTEGGEQVNVPQPRTPAQDAQRIQQADRWVAVDGEGEELPDYRTASRAIEYLEKHRDKPFFLAVGFVKPHVPLIAPKRYFDLYNPADIQLPPDFAPQPTVRPGAPEVALSRNGDLFINREATEAQAREAIAAYYANVSWTDSQVGRVLDALDRLQLRERTLIVFFGDHGWHLGEKGKWSKHNSLYEPATHVPLIISPPSPPANGKVSPRTVELLDIYPTLVEFCGLPAPSGLQGASLKPLLENPRAKWDRPACTVAQRGNVMGKSVRNERYRYTEWNDGRSGYELYDYQTDPHELHNLANDPKHSETAAQLQRMLRARFAARATVTVPKLGSGKARAGRSPNIVIFLADDLGYGDLGCYGHPVIKTPNLDRFAQQAMKFTQCYSAGSVCSPSRSAILTGRTPYRNGVFTWIPAGQDVHLRRSEVTIARLLKEHGYTTCHVGKWHLNGHFNDPRHPQPDYHGYDWWLGTQNNAGPSHKNPDNFVRNGMPVGELEGFSSALVASEAIDWLKNHRDRSKPFFLTVWTHEPHLPIETDPRFMARYSQIADSDVRQHHGNVTQMDEAFGTLMRTLDELRLAENTVVVFTSDNGPEGDGIRGRSRGSTGGLRGRKRAVYEGGIRVPGIIRWPGRIKPGSVSDEPIIGSDIFATICDIAKIQPPTDRVIDGASILPALDGRHIERKVPMYWRWGNAPGGVQIAMRKGDWKVLAPENLSRFELYNLRIDPRETKDLSETEPQHCDALQKELRELNAQIEAEGPQWWRGYTRW